VKSTALRRAIVPGISVLAMVALSACGSNSTNNASLSGSLAAGGSSAQEAAQAAWIVGFNKDQPDVAITYDPVGSGGGKTNFISKAYPFAGSDSPLDEAKKEVSQATARCGGKAPIEVPNYVSPVALIFHVDGVDKLNLSTAAIGGIFTGKVTKWNDPLIAADNKDAKLPAAAINMVHRSDDSGTTKNFLKYLAAIDSKVVTADLIGETYPAAFKGEGAKGTSGVVSAVKNGKNSIGYADASQAGDLDTASVGVGDSFVAPSADAAAKIFEASKRASSATDTQLVYDIAYTTTDKSVYPIVLASYLIACPSYTGADAKTGKLVKAYFQYILSDDGQAQGEKEAGSAVLSDALLKEARTVVDGITVK
jgi:phosphate transport system substrate-binding protein